MALLIIAFSVLLMLGGAGYILLGFDIVMTERGAAMTIGGAVALSGGVVGLGVGFALLRLSQILRVLETGSPGGATSAEAGRIPAADAPTAEAPQDGGGKLILAGGVAAAAGIAAAGASAAPEPASPPDEPAPHLPLERATVAEIDRLLAEPADVIGRPQETEAEAPPPEPAPAAPQRPGRLDFLLRRKRPKAPEPDDAAAGEDQPAAAEAAVPEPLPADSAGEPEPATAEAPEPDVAEAAASDESDAPAPESAAEAPAPPGRTILGSYRAGGRTYTMFSDGSVEALTEEGVERFESMDALRAHLART